MVSLRWLQLAMTRAKVCAAVSNPEEWSLAPRRIRGRSSRLAGSVVCRATLLLTLVGDARYPTLASDWHRFRGPNGGGVSEATRLPVEFGTGKNMLWKTPLPPGHSSPVLAGDRLFVTGFENESLATVAVSAQTGTVLWRRDVKRTGSAHYHANNNPASPSPVTDGFNVYVFFQEFGLISYTAEGKERWRLPLGPFRNYKGMAASPILACGLVVLACDQDAGSFLLAVDKDTGSVRWRTERAEITGNGHATPAWYESKDGAQVIVLGSGQVAGYRLDSGIKVWWVRGLSIQPKASPVIAADESGRVSVYILAPGSEGGTVAPVQPFADFLPTLDKNHDGKLTTEELKSFNQADADGDGTMSEREYVLFMSGGAIPSALIAIDPEGRGDLTDKGVRWRYGRGLPVVPSPILYRGVLYLLKAGGILTALDARSGSVLKQVRLRGALDNYFASPVAVEGRLYLVSQDGHVAVVRASSKLEILAVNDMGEECFATPAVAQGRLFVRTRKALHAFGHLQSAESKQTKLNKRSAP